MRSPVAFGRGACSTLGFEVAAGVPLGTGDAGAVVAAGDAVVSACRAIGTAAAARRGAFAEATSGAALTAGVLAWLDAVTSSAGVAAAFGVGSALPCAVIAGAPSS